MSGPLLTTSHYGHLARQIPNLFETELMLRLSELVRVSGEIGRDAEVFSNGVFDCLHADCRMESLCSRSNERSRVECWNGSKNRPSCSKDVSVC